MKDRRGHGNRERRNNRNDRQIQEDSTVGEDGSQSPGSEHGKTSSGGEYMTQKDHEDAHFFAFIPHNTKAYGHDKFQAEQSTTSSRRGAAENWKSPAELH